MKERLARLRVVQKLIKAHCIESQEELLCLLHKEGFPVTQATLSRDLKLLKVSKLLNNYGGYCYSLPTEDEKRESASVHDFLEGYISIEWSGNLVVIKTYSGHSASVALAIENLGGSEVLGTISGRDNTVFVCLREGVTGEMFMCQMKKCIPELEN
ncbi:MAG: ArgR family transcriptional regulator [Spirochaetaceae bacterium]|nr:ArgR family transcriptional regulator [Spirochaetaceae bacterium]